MKKSDLLFAFILLPVDIAAIIFSFILAYYLRSGLEASPYLSSFGLKEYMRYSLFLLPFWVALIGLNGLYNIKPSKSIFKEIFKITTASSSAIILLIIAIFLTKTTFFSRLILIFTWIISIFAISLGRLIVHYVRVSLLRYGIGQRNVVLIGDNQTSESVISHLSQSRDRIFKICGILNGSSTESKYGLKILGSVDDIEKIIKKYQVDEIVLTDINISKSKIMNLIQICSDHKIIFKYIPDTFSLMTLNVSPELIGSMPVMELKSIPLDGWGRIVKRLIDVLISSSGLIILSPIFVITGILIKLTSRGPIIYSHERIGRDERVFYCHKFRSMAIDKCDFSKGGAKWTTEKDNQTRITPLGKILRKTNIDELPQLWNILIGEMSFIGPRPEQPKFVEKFEKEIPDYFKRHRVKAGLTGWAQVNGLKGDTSIKERVRYDMYYIENWSLWLDLKIFLKTILLIIYEIFGGKYEYRSRS